jgi:glycosyltransferase involved in cell wall biosynthesis
MTSAPILSIVLPARDESAGLRRILPQLCERFAGEEIIVVNDGSTDDTVDVCAAFPVRVISHPYPKGNGAAIKTGVHAARGRILATMDADGQHDPADIRRLIDRYETGYHMVVGARNAGSQASWGRLLANKIYNWVASWMVGQRVADLTSGLRVANADKFREFMHLLPNGFSYPTTITMSFFRAGYSVAYEPIQASEREGRSHINLLRDGARFLLIIFKIGTLYSPLKMFVPISALHFLVGLSYYGYTYVNYGRFTNMSALLLITSVLIFLIGLVSEQITSLIYQSKR